MLHDLSPLYDLGNLESVILTGLLMHMPNARECLCLQSFKLCALCNLPPQGTYGVKGEASVPQGWVTKS